MKRLFIKFRKNENGAVLVITAAALLAIVGMLAMVADIGALVLERNRLQNACDAAALAAAWELPNTDMARGKAGDYLEMNGVDLTEAAISFNSNNTTVSVEARRPVKYHFAGVLGLDSGQAAARSTAAYGSVSGMTGVVPFGIPEQEMNFGVEYQLKAGSQDDYGPGNYGPLALELRGAKSFLNNLKYGHDGVIKVGDWIDTEPGNMSGPTADGVNYRIGSCNHYPKCTIDSYHSDCPRVMVVPIYDPDSLAGRDQVKIVGFGAFLLKGVEGSGNDSRVSGYFLEIVPPDGLQFSITKSG